MICTISVDPNAAQLSGLPVAGRNGERSKPKSSREKNSANIEEAFKAVQAIRFADECQAIPIATECNSQTATPANTPYETTCNTPHYVMSPPKSPEPSATVLATADEDSRAVQSITNFAKDYLLQHSQPAASIVDQIDRHSTDVAAAQSSLSPKRMQPPKSGGDDDESASIFSLR